MNGDLRSHNGLAMGTAKAAPYLSDEVIVNKDAGGAS